MEPTYDPTPYPVRNGSAHPGRASDGSLPGSPVRTLGPARGGRAGDGRAGDGHTGDGPARTGPAPEGPAPDGRAPHGLTKDALRREIADALGEDPAEITDDENLFDLGLDSVRLMALVRRWRALGADVAFEDLAERPVLAHWWTVLGGAR